MIVDDDVFYGQSIFKSIECDDVEGVRNGILVDEINVANTYDGSTYLMLAVCKSNVEIIKLLLDSGADMYAKNDFGDMAIHLAAKSRGVSIMKVFCENGCDLNVMGQSATPIGYALRFGELQVARYLAECGASIDIADEFGVTARDFSLFKGIQ